MSDQQVEKHVSRGTLEKLLKAGERCTSQVGTARQAYGDELTKAANKGLNKFAFGVVKRLWHQDPAQAAQNIRALNLYIEQLGLASQLDLEDAIDDADDTVPTNGATDEEWEAAAPH